VFPRGLGVFKSIHIVSLANKESSTREAGYRIGSRLWSSLEFLEVMPSGLAIDGIALYRAVDHSTGLRYTVKAMEKFDLFLFSQS